MKNIYLCLLLSWVAFAVCVWQLAIYSAVQAVLWYLAESVQSRHLCTSEIILILVSYHQETLLTWFH